jgi:hypothetical protein
MRKQGKLNRLTLSRETLHHLEAREGARVAAGTGFNTCQISCQPTCLEGTSCVVCPPTTPGSTCQ